MLAKYLDWFKRQSREKRILYGMFAVSVVGGFLFATYQARLHGGQAGSYTVVWRSIISADPAFSFLLPPNARHTVEGTRHTFSAEGAHQNFYTVTVAYSIRPATADADKMEVEKLLQAQPHNQLLEIATTSLGGRKAVGFLIQNFDSGRYVRGYIVRYGNAVYTLAALYPYSTFDPGGYQKFINSFTLETLNYKTRAPRTSSRLPKSGQGAREKVLFAKTEFRNSSLGNFEL